MYEQFFGLREEPFRLTPDPSYLYLSSKHAETLAHLKLCLSESSGFVCITGDVGAGKTTLVRLFLSELGPNVSSAYTFVPPLSAVELLRRICREFKLPVADQTQGELVDELHAYLMAQHSAGRISVLILDEAQALSIELLEQIRLLLNIETDTHKLLRIVLIGQPQLRKLLLDPDLAQLNQRITLRWHLGPLSARETAAYVRHRLSVASGGAAVRIFTGPALRLLHALSGGVPRLVNMLAHRALLAAYILRTPKVNRWVVMQAYREIQAVPLPGTLSRARKLAIAAAGLAVGIGLVIVGAPQLDWLDARWSPARSAVVSRPAVRGDGATSRAAAGTSGGSRTAATIANGAAAATTNAAVANGGRAAPGVAGNPASSAANAAPAAREATSIAGAAPAVVARADAETTAREAPRGDAPAAASAASAAAAPAAPADAAALAAPAVAGRDAAAGVTAGAATAALDAPGDQVAARARPAALAATDVAARLATADPGVTARSATATLLAAWSERPLAAGEARLPDELDSVAWRRGLQHVAFTGNRSMLRLLDLPAMLALRVPGTDVPRYAALVGMDGTRATLAIGDVETTVDAATFERLWTGQAELLWRDFESLGAVPTRGARGVGIARLQRLLRRVGALQRPETGIFDATTEAAVIAFQRAHQLQPDGRVGPLTRVVLYGTAGGYLPPALARAYEGNA